MLFYAKPYEEEFYFSACKNYRYKRWVKWSDKKPCVFVMRNPKGSTEEKISKTAEKCREIAMINDCGSLISVNLCAYIAEDWETLKKAKEEGINIVEKEKGDNEKHLRIAVNELDALIIVAWGSKGKYLEDEVKSFKELTRKLNKPIYCLGLLNKNQPMQPTARNFSYSGLSEFLFD